MIKFFVLQIIFLSAVVSFAIAQDLIVPDDDAIIEKIEERFLPEINYSQTENFIVKNVTRGSVFKHYIGIGWVNINSGDVLNKDTQICITYNSSLVLSDGINTFIVRTGMENGKIDSLINLLNSDIITPDKMTIGFNLNPAGFIISGPSINLDFTKRTFNSEINIVFPSLGYVSNNEAAGGFGILGTFNYFRRSQLGGFYLGGGLGYIYTKLLNWSEHLFTFGANTGYKFITNSGMYYRVGGFIGLGFINGDESFDINAFLKPDLSIGYSF